MTTYILDHIVHLTPPGTVELVSSQFRKLGFEVLPGGTHADGLTSNALVVLPDGAYIELLAFLHPSPPPPPSHRWGTAGPGWIDYAHLGHSPSHDTVPISRIINTRAARDKSGVRYLGEVDGGREMPDSEPSPHGGRILKWRITAPAALHGIGRLPFFCGDVTPRAWRVPEAGNHSNTARGISHVKVLATSPDEFVTLVAQLSTVVGKPPLSTTRSVATWHVETPKAIPGLRATLIVEDASSTGVVESAYTSGIHEVGFWVEKSDGSGAEGPYGKIVWTPIPSSI